MTSASSLPLIVLGGSDRRAAELPPEAAGKHPLTGLKGIDLRVGGRPIVEWVVERFRETGAFEPVYLVGPAGAYASLDLPVRRLDADGTFGANLRAALERVRAEHPDRPVAFTTCDILPERADLEEALEDFRKHAPCDLFYPVVRAPEDRSRLGASAWKPTYRLPPRPGEAPVEVLPGHLVIVDPSSVRLGFVYELFQIGYRTRNRSILDRRRAMAWGVLLGLFRQDLLHLLALRAPTLTWDVLGAGLPAGRRLREGLLDREGLEDACRRILVKREHRRAHPGRRFRIPFVTGLSLALDIDTEEEARSFGVELPGS